MSLKEFEKIKTAYENRIENTGRMVDMTDMGEQVDEVNYEKDVVEQY